MARAVKRAFGVGAVGIKMTVVRICVTLFNVCNKTSNQPGNLKGQFPTAFTRAITVIRMVSKIAVK